MISRRLKLIFGLLIGLPLWPWPAIAIVGGAANSEGAGLGRHLVLIVGSRGNSCTGTAMARDVVLTVAHCVLPGSDYKIVQFESGRAPQLLDVRSVARHPKFNLQTLLAHRATADVALLKLAAALPAKIIPATLGEAGETVAAGEHLAIAGYGVTVRGDGRSGGTARTAILVAVGQPGTLQIRLADPATAGERAGLGACTGDSGAPAFRDGDGQDTVIGIVSWSTGPNGSEGCGGLTGLTPLTLYRDWIRDMARQLGSPLP